MPKWRKGETVFGVSVSYHKIRGYQACIPKPIIERLGGPEQIKFVLKGDRIEVERN